MDSMVCYSSLGFLPLILVLIILVVIVLFYHCWQTYSKRRAKKKESREVDRDIEKQNLAAKDCNGV